MSLPVEIKINHLTSLHEARFAAGMGVSYIGFNIHPNTVNHLTPEEQKGILSWLDGVNAVAEIGEWSFEDKLAQIEPYAYNYIETSNWKSAIYILKNTDLGLIFRTHLNADWSFLQTELAKYAKKDIFLHIADGENYDDAVFKKISDLSKQFKVLLGFGFNINNVRGMIAATGVQGISLSGTHEEIVGMANFDKNAELIEFLSETGL